MGEQIIKQWNGFRPPRENSSAFLIAGIAAGRTGSTAFFSSEIGPPGLRFFNKFEGFF
jgi:hypothetical protein